MFAVTQGLCLFRDATKAVLWLRRLGADLSAWSPGFISRPVRAVFVVVEVALGQVSVPVPLLFVPSVSLHQCSNFRI